MTVTTGPPEHGPWQPVFPNEGVDAMTIDSGPKAGLQLGFAGSQTAPAGAEIDLPII
jgi:hypothetical protein